MITERRAAGSRRQAAAIASALAWVLMLAFLRRVRRPAGDSALFLGDNGHHKPAERAAVLIPAMQRVGIEVTYTDKLAI